MTNDNDAASRPIRVLFVCMGNICRSPTAHGVFAELLAAAGLADRIEVDSAGTHGYHVGAPPDARSQHTARTRGVDLARLRSRRFGADDFHEFDYVLAMDRDNLADMLALRPDDARAKVHLMLDFAPDIGSDEIPDPYFGDTGFERVFDMIDVASRGLLAHLREQHGL